MVDVKEMQNPLVFVSYSWDNIEHNEWVLKLATRLRNNGVDVVLDRWDTRLGSDLSLFMEKSGDTIYRVLAVVTEQYVRKANAAQGGVGFERKMITPSLMEDLHGSRVIPVLRHNPERKLPRFLGSAKYIDFQNEKQYEDKYYELLQDIYGIQTTPKPPLGKNPFAHHSEEEVPMALRHDPSRYMTPALKGTVSFNYTNNNGRFLIGTGERAFSLDFGPAGNGAIYIYNDSPEIKTVALAPGARGPIDIGDASQWDGSSRVRVIHTGDAAVLRNQNNYWAVVFVDKVSTRKSSSAGEPSISFRYLISTVPTLNFASAL